MNPHIDLPVEENAIDFQLQWPYPGVITSYSIHYTKLYDMKFMDFDPGPAGEMRAQRVQDAMVDVCENLKDRFAVLDCPQTRDVEYVKRWRRRTNSSFAAYYWPWIEVPAAAGGTRMLPPSGIMAGIFSAQEIEHGVHQAPANVPIVGAVDP